MLNSVMNHMSTGIRLSIMRSVLVALRGQRGKPTTSTKPLAVVFCVYFFIDTGSGSGEVHFRKLRPGTKSLVTRLPSNEML